MREDSTNVFLTMRPLRTRTAPCETAVVISSLIEAGSAIEPSFSDLPFRSLPLRVVTTMLCDRFLVFEQSREHVPTSNLRLPHPCRSHARSRTAATTVELRPIRAQ